MTADVHKTPNHVTIAVRDAALTALIAFGIFTAKRKSDGTAAAHRA